MKQTIVGLKGILGILMLLMVGLYVLAALWFSIDYIKTDTQIWSGFSLQSLFMSGFIIAVVLFAPILIGGFVTGLVMDHLGERLGTFVGFVIMFLFTYAMIVAAIHSVTGVNIHEFFIKLWTTNIF